MTFLVKIRRLMFVGSDRALLCLTQRELFQIFLTVDLAISSNSVSRILFDRCKESIARNADPKITSNSEKIVEKSKWGA